MPKRVFGFRPRGRQNRVIVRRAEAWGQFWRCWLRSLQNVSTSSPTYICNSVDFRGDDRIVALVWFRGFPPTLVDCLRLVEAMSDEGAAVRRFQIFPRSLHEKKHTNPLTSSSSETQNRLESWIGQEFSVSAQACTCRRSRSCIPGPTRNREKKRGDKG